MFTHKFFYTHIFYPTHTSFLLSSLSKTQYTHTYFSFFLKYIHKNTKNLFSFSIFSPKDKQKYTHIFLPKTHSQIHTRAKKSVVTPSPLSHRHYRRWSRTPDDRQPTTTPLFPIDIFSLTSATPSLFSLFYHTIPKLLTNERTPT